MVDPEEDSVDLEEDQVKYTYLYSFSSPLCVCVCVCLSVSLHCLNAHLFAYLWCDLIDSSLIKDLVTSASYCSLLE